jgi:hypothetical protein
MIHSVTHTVGAAVVLAAVVDTAVELDDVATGVDNVVAVATAVVGVVVATEPDAKALR